MNLLQFDRAGYLISHYDNQIEGWQDAFLKALISIGNEFCIEKLMHIALNSENSDLRYQAVSGLGNIASKECVADLEWIRQNDVGEDFEGFKISDAASEAIYTIQHRK